MKRLILWLGVSACLLPAPCAAQGKFTLEQVLSAPFPANLVTSQTGARLAWTFDMEGRRNIWVAEGPKFEARELTSYSQDDGEELSELSFSADGATIVYVRGEGKNSAGEYANPTSNPAGVEQAVWAVKWSGGAPVKIDAGHSPVLSAKGVVAYAREGQIYLAALQSSDKPKHVAVRGKNEPVEWSPDGARLLFVSDRGDHSFVGIYDANSQSVKYVTPSVDHDSDPVWSRDGKRIAFVRQPAVTRDSPSGFFIEPDRSHPWAIWITDADSGKAREIWHSGIDLQDSYPYMAQDTGGGVLHWAAGDHLVFASEQSGWQHLYAISADGGTAKELTPGNCEIEQWSFSADKSSMVFNSNCEDVDRRHLWSVSVAGGRPEQLTKGTSIDWGAVLPSDGHSLAYFSSDAQHPGRLFVKTLEKDAKPMEPAASTFPAGFPAGELVTPQQVVFKAIDGLEIHGQLFTPRGLKSGEKRPALIFLHGGPIRQMLLGWHYMYYYSNSYGMNQYLANRGYIVLSVNYRSGIGYGRGFREAPGRAGRGASEYRDVVAAGKYLQSRSDVDASRIGLWGGSYGGYLTALGLGRNSELFAAGVDMHGVHDWPTDNWEGKNVSPELTKLAHDSSPVTAVDSWKSPVLLIHGDDDRNVIFSQTVDLTARLRRRGVSVEELIFPDEIHDFLLHRDWVRAYQASGEFFDRRFVAPGK